MHIKCVMSAKNSPFGSSEGSCCSALKLPCSSNIENRSEVSNQDVNQEN